MAIQIDKDSFMVLVQIVGVREACEEAAAQGVTLAQAQLWLCSKI